MPKMPRTYLQPAQHHHNGSNHHRPERGGYYASNEKFFWVLISLIAVVPIIILVLKIRHKLSERCQSHQEGERCRRSIRRTPLEVRLSDSASIYTITKQDYMNLAPPRYSVISQNPVPTTYEKPPPYSPTPG